MIRTTLLASAVAFAATGAAASLINFETPATGGGAAGSVGSNSLTVGDVTFTSNGDLAIAEVGDPLEGFVNDTLEDDTPNDPGALGTFFLTTALRKTSVLDIDYANPVSGLNFDLVDIDGSQINQPEQFVIRFFDENDVELVGLAKTFTGDTGNPDTGDGVLTNVSVSSMTLIGRVSIEGTRPTGTADVGIAFDNFDVDSPAPIPLPAGLPLLAGGLGAMAWLRRRQRG